MKDHIDQMFILVLNKTWTIADILEEFQRFGTTFELNDGAVIGFHYSKI